MNFRHETGDNFTTRFQERLPQGLVSIFAVPRGSERVPAVNNVDIRLEKAFPISKGDLRVTADIFNLFNAGYVGSVGTIFGQGSYLQPLTFSSAREVRLGVRYTF
jgi:outer membrane receptor protein involved in Fe transport